MCGTLAAIYSSNARPVACETYAKIHAYEGRSAILGVNVCMQCLEQNPQLTHWEDMPPISVNCESYELPRYYVELRNKTHVPLKLRVVDQAAAHVFPVQLQSDSIIATDIPDGPMAIWLENMREPTDHKFFRASLFLADDMADFTKCVPCDLGNRALLSSEEFGIAANTNAIVYLQWYSANEMLIDERRVTVELRAKEKKQMVATQSMAATTDVDDDFELLEDD